MVGPISFEILCNWKILMLLVTDLCNFRAAAIFAQSLLELFYFAGICLSFCSGMTYTG